MPGLIDIKFKHNDALVKRGLGKVRAKVRDSVQIAALQEAVEPLVDRAKALSPVESGALRHSIRAFRPKRRAGKFILAVGADGRVRRRWKGSIRVPSTYAGYVEFGTSRMEGRRFMTRAIFQTRSEVRRRLIRTLRESR